MIGGNMTAAVPAISIVAMGIAGALGIAIPLVLLFYFLKKGADIPPFFVGCLTFFIFALVLEQIVHSVVLSTQAGKTIQANIWLMGLYGGLMAGFFEESGRLLAFKFPLRKFREKNINALMYGAGHGGFEALMIFSVTMVSNIVISVMINTGSISLITDSLPADQVDLFMAQIQSLTTSVPGLFFLGLLERAIAISFHICNSVLVWFAVKNNKKPLYFIAILLHAVMDFVAVALGRSGKPGSEYYTEVALLVIVVATAFFVRHVWKKESVE
jgi:uncharacterized membrane protein YhfC